MFADRLDDIFLTINRLDGIFLTISASISLRVMTLSIFLIAFLIIFSIIEFGFDWRDPGVVTFYCSLMALLSSVFLATRDKFRIEASGESNEESGNTNAPETQPESERQMKLERLLAISALLVMIVFFISILKFGFDLKDSQRAFYYFILLVTFYLVILELPTDEAALHNPYLRRYIDNELPSDGVPDVLKDGNATVLERRKAMKNILSFKSVTEKEISAWAERDHKNYELAGGHFCLNRGCSDEDSVYTNGRHVSSCSICIDEYDVGDEYFAASKCSHIFHSDCILLWLEKHYECPVCREQLVDPNEVASEVQLVRRINSSNESEASKLQGNIPISNEDEIVHVV